VVLAVTGEQGLGRAVQVEGLHPPGRSDVGGHLLGTQLTVRRDRLRSYAQPALELLEREQRNHRRIAHQPLRLMGVERGDDLAQRGASVEVARRVLAQIEAETEASGHVKWAGGADPRDTHAPTGTGRHAG
jgi:hypothetical protein